MYHTNNNSVEYQMLLYSEMVIAVSTKGSYQAVLMTRSWHLA